MSECFLIGCTAENPPPVYTISPPTINLETGGYVFRGDSPPPYGWTAQLRKDQLPPSYHKLFPSALPPIEIVPTHPIQPPAEVQQHVPYG